MLVDTSVWIRSLAGRALFVRGLGSLLERDEVLTHELVEGELLVGDRGGRGAFLDSYQKLSRAPTVSHAEVVSFVRARKLHGRGIGWVDAHLLASTIVARVPLWTADAELASIATELGIGYVVERA